MKCEALLETSEVHRADRIAQLGSSDESESDNVLLCSSVSNQVERIAHYAIRETRLRLRMTQMLGTCVLDEFRAASLGESLLADFDHWRGDRPSLWPWPRPQHLQPQDLLDFAAVLRRAATMRGPLQQAFRAVAEHAHACGLQQIQKSHLQ